MLYFIERLLGWRCCGEWTQWEVHKADFERESEPGDGNAYIESRNITYTRRWQERRCTMCGKIQIQSLPLY